MPNAPRLAALITTASLTLALAACASGKKDGVARSLPEQPNTAEAILHGTEADRRLREGEHAEAYQSYLDCIAQDNEFYPCWNNLGTLLMQEDAYLEAYEAFSIASSLRPDEPRPEYNLGLLFSKRRHLDDALEHYLKALDRDPDYLPALRSAIVTVVDLRRPSEDALAWIKRAQFLDSDPDWLDYYQTHKLRFESQLTEPSG